MIALNVQGEPSKHSVAVILATNENLTSCIGVLEAEGETDTGVVEHQVVGSLKNNTYF